MDNVSFLGQDCVVLENASLRLLVTRSVGPRILSLQLDGGENLFAELPDFVTDCPGSGIYHFRGGHRLWHSPEVPTRTYLPDDTPVQIEAIENGLNVTQDVEPKTGLQKSMKVELGAGSPCITVTHRISNTGLWPVTCALWAITQLRKDGLAILPQTCTDTGVLPNRSLALWPYTNPGEPNVTWGRYYVLVRASMSSAFKLGFSNPRGWLAYWWNGTLFVKRAAYNAQTEYYDFGSSSEFYCNDKFLELETLSPIVTIQPGAWAEHVETWELYNNIAEPQNENGVQALVDSLHLEA
ncbi:MAG TPA: hypothetical protein PK078_06030 [Anaerolineales bacterium]|nr:hypothetical protein [Anaerolineales bacterium]